MSEPNPNKNEHNFSEAKRHFDLGLRYESEKNFLIGMYICLRIRI